MRRVVVLSLLLVAAVSAGILIIGDGDSLSTEEEVKHGTNPFLADTDADGLPDGEEISLKTNPRDSDTDRDGLPDGAEAKSTGPLADADPLRWDIFVEVDRMPEERLTFSERRSLKKAFADAPVTNPDGTVGVNLHIRVSDRIPFSETTQKHEYHSKYEPKYRDYDGKGYYYMVLVNDVKGSGSENLAGYGWTGEGGLVQTSNNVGGETFMHELGHAMGLTKESYGGIDSRSVPANEYRSIMNYNYPCEGCDPYVYSRDRPFNDWEYVKENYSPPRVNRLLR